MDSSSSKATKKEPDEAPSSQPQRPTAACNVHDEQHDLDDPICLKDWWRKLQVMHRLPRINNVDPNKNIDKVPLLRFLTKAEEFRYEFGDSAVPSHMRFRVRNYEHNLGINELKRTDWAQVSM